MAINVLRLSKLVIEQMHGTSSDKYLIEAVAVRAERAQELAWTTRNLLIQRVCQHAKQNSLWLGGFWSWIEQFKVKWLTALRSYTDNKLPYFVGEQDQKEQLEFLIAFLASVPDIAAVDRDNLYDMVERGINQTAFNAAQGGNFYVNVGKYELTTKQTPESLRDECAGQLEKELLELFGSQPDLENYDYEQDLDQALEASIDSISRKGEMIDRYLSDDETKSTDKGETLPK